MVRRITHRTARILACFLCAALLLALAPQTCAQQVSPALLQAAKEASQQALNLEPSVLGPRQERVAATQELSDWNALYQLRLGDRIVCQTKVGLTHRAKFTFLSEQAIGLRVGKNVVTLPREQVASVKLLRRGHRGKTALLGAAIGFSSMIMLAAVDGEGLGPALVAGTLFGGLGALAGAIVGWPKETIIYRANPEPSVR